VAILTIARRYLLILAVIFWQGGFTFHSLVVVHVAHRVLGSRVEQGYITRIASDYMNLAGAVALALWSMDITLTADPRDLRRRLRWAIWAIMLLALGVLAWLHLRLDQHLASDEFRVIDRPLFRDLHRWYLHSSTVQWVGALVLIAATLAAWRAEDRSESKPGHTSPRSICGEDKIERAHLASSGDSGGTTSNR